MVVRCIRIFMFFGWGKKKKKKKIESTVVVLRIVVSWRFFFSFPTCSYIASVSLSPSSPFFFSFFFFLFPTHPSRKINNLFHICVNATPVLSRGEEKKKAKSLGKSEPLTVFGCCDSLASRVKEHGLQISLTARNPHKRNSNIFFFLISFKFFIFFY